LSEAIMQVRRDLRLVFMLLALVLHACAGGSGSSGFDVTSENAAIHQALTEPQHCVEHDGLTICPAGVSPTGGPGTVPTPTPTATASPTVATTPLITTTPSAFRTPTQTPTIVRTQAPTTPTLAAPTETPGLSGPRIDTGLDGATSVVCIQSAPVAPCSFMLPFAPRGFPPNAVYRVAERLDSNGRWSIGPELAATTPTDGSFDAPVAVSTQPPQSGEVTVQLAVLVFLSSSRTVPAEVEQLADTGASFAFLTSELVVHTQIIGTR
jgi:hypothetical protein